MSEIKQTCLHDKHVAMGAQMSPFAGYDMPIQYRGIAEEHNAVRNACGMFDVSHMGEVNVKGPQAEQFVNYIFTNDVAGAPVGQCFYGMMLNDRGGVVDDLLVYKRADDEFLLVINASNIDKDFAWITSHAPKYDVTVTNLSEQLGEIAIQGPEAENCVRDILGIDCSDLAFYTFKELDIDGEHIIISRTGYTGEDGFEVYASHKVIVDYWNRLLESGRVEPCGLGCRDTLRFEVGLPLYGDELTDDITPVEAGLSMFAKLDKPEFIGRDTVERQKAEGVTKKVVGLEVLDRAIPRHGYEVLNAEGEVIGEITTGYHCISVDKSHAMALIDSKYAKLDTPLQVRIRRKVYPAVVTKKKFYKKSYKQ